MLYTRGANLPQLLKDRILVLDGAMGTMLQDAGLTDGGAPELWNVEHPDKVADILDQYAKNGANLLTTNTFGGTKPRLQMHQLEERVFELNKAAAELAKKVAPIDTTVLLTGETGTGKEVFANAIHQSGSRKDKNFVAINCSAFSHDLLESEMFGHKAGAFTGALALAGLVLAAAFRAGFATGLPADLTTGLATGLATLLAPDLACALTGFFGF